MKKHKKLGEVLEISDLNRSAKRITHVTTIDEIQGSGLIDRISDGLGAIVGSGKAYFLNIKNPARPEIISRILLKSDPGGYANQLSGLYKNYALFSIGYRGVEVVNISDLQAPISLGLVKEYGSTLKMLFMENLCINESGIYDVSDIMRPQILKRFEERAIEFLQIGNSVIISSGTGIHSVKLNGIKEFIVSTTITRESLRGLSKIAKIGENYLLAATFDGLRIIECSSDEKRLELITTLPLEVVPDSSIITGKLCIARTIPYLGHILLAYNLEEPVSPKLVFALDVEDLGYFTANEEYIVFGGTSTININKQTPERSLIVLKAYLNSPPEYIDFIITRISSNYGLLDNVIYLFEEEGLKLFEIH